MKSDTDVVETTEVPAEDVPMIVSHKQVMQPDGSMATITHGPMPVSEWAAYEKAHHL